MRLRRIVTLAVLPVFLTLAGCQALQREDGAEASAASPITGGAIAVTALDAPSAPTPAAAEPAPAEPAPAEPAPVDPVIAEPAAPVAVRSPAQIACERRGGLWSSAGGGSAAFCQTPTRDAGKSCQASTDCTGYCLEKSRSCAPVSPMLGCHDILNEAGRMLTQCIN